MTAITLVMYICQFFKVLRNQIKFYWRLTVAFVILSIIIGFLPIAGAVTTLAPATSAKSEILIEAYSGTVLHEHNADKHMLIASTTKILTALVVLKNCDVNEKVIIQDDFPPIEGSSIYLKPGEELTVLDLLYGLLLESGNDSAVALAFHVSESIESFSELMNECASTLGCRNSHFVNPHGLDQENHYSTARDLALISAEAMNNKTFSDIVSTKRISIAGRYFKNHNKLLWNYPGTIGIKTGFTESAGRSLVSCTERDGMRLICVTLSAPKDWNDHTNLYNWAYNQYDCIQVAIGDQTYNSVPVISGITETVSVHPAEDFLYVYSRADKMELSCVISKFFYAPVTQNTKAGMITIKKNGETIKEIPLLFSETVSLDEAIPLSFFERLKWSLKHQK